jgi:hypothetical protein
MFQWIGTFCRYNAGTPQPASIYGDNVWAYAGRLTWPASWGCSAWVDVDARWNNQTQTPTPTCRVTASDQTLSGWTQTSCGF